MLRGSYNSGFGLRAFLLTKKAILQYGLLLDLSNFRVRFWTACISVDEPLLCISEHATSNSYQWRVPGGGGKGEEEKGEGTCNG